MAEGFWLKDNETNEHLFYTYQELRDLDEEIQEAVYKPIGGFCYPVNLFVAMPVVDTPFYIDNWLPKQGKVMFYAPAKAGKTTLAIQMARCIGAGEPILGIGVQRASVLYIQAELSPAVIRKKFTDTGQVYDNVSVGTSFNLKLDETGGQEMLANAIDAINPGVVILDPLYKMMKGDENLAQDTLKVCDFLDAMIESYGCSIVLIHHSGKDLERGGRGSSVLEGWVDSNIQVKRISPPQEPLKIRITPTHLRHAALPPEPMEAELIDGEFSLMGLTETLTETVMFIVNDGLQHATADIVADTGASRSGVNKVIDKLIRDGKIIKPKRGLIQIAPKEIELGIPT